VVSARAAAGHLDAAIEACRKILELDPGNAQAQVNLQKLIDAQGSDE
jgi:predicted TPR repeat methyltransferase